MNRHLIIEIGTNSIKHLYANYTNERWEIISEQVYPVRPGEGVSATGMISAAAMQRCIETIDSIMALYPIEQDITYHIIATESLRRPSNADEFTILIYDRFKLQVEVLSGDEEAQLSFIAGSHICKNTGGYIGVLDIGGGSTELSIGLNGRYTNSASLPIGAVRLTEMYIKHDPITTTELDALQAKIKDAIQQLASLPKINYLVGVGGTISALARLSTQDFTAIKGMKLSLKDIQTKTEMLGKLTINEKANLPGMPRSRADIIFAGSLILFNIEQLLCMDELIVSTEGVRYGYLYSRCV
jgi:exopolyphosphatase / guanosine-5'-triphosphate,3'-diphosphate pyrophosphatase